MFVYDNLGSVVAGVFVAGIASHFLRRWRERRFYVDFRDAYEASVRRVHETNCAPAAVVRCKEFEREFMRLTFPPWFWGFGRWVWAVVKVCVAVALAAFFARGAVGDRQSAVRAPVGSPPAARQMRTQAGTWLSGAASLSGGWASIPTVSQGGGAVETADHSMIGVGEKLHGSWTH